MPVLRLPRSDQERALLLERIIATGTADSAAGRVYLPQRMLDDAQAALNAFRPLLENMAQLLSERKREIEERDTAADALARHARAFRMGVLQRQAYLLLPDSYVTLYNVGLSPEHPSAQEWIAIANGYLLGEADAVEAGYAPMCNPSAAELQAARDAAQAELDDVDMADREQDMAQNEMMGQRPSLDRLIRAISAQLNASLYDLPLDDIRHIKRTYGYAYAETGEPEAPEV